MKPPANSIARMVIIRLAAVVVVGLVAYLVAGQLEIDPLGPALIATVIMLVKLVLTYRTDETE